MDFDNISKHLKTSAYLLSGFLLTGLSLTNYVRVSEIALRHFQAQALSGLSARLVISSLVGSLIILAIATDVTAFLFTKAYLNHHNQHFLPLTAYNWRAFPNQISFFMHTVIF